MHPDDSRPAFYVNCKSRDATDKDKVYEFKCYSKSEYLHTFAKKLKLHPKVVKDVKLSH